MQTYPANTAGKDVWYVAVTPLFHISSGLRTEELTLALRGQRIVARLRERTFEAALRQEVEFVEKGEGDVLSRLSADSSIVGERCVPPSMHAATDRRAPI